MRHQANLNRKKSPKTQSFSSRSQSFGMKMNKQHSVQKDKISFGAPKWWEKIDSGVRKATALVLMPQVFLGVGFVEVAIDSVANADKYENLSEKEKFLRQTSKLMGGFAMLNEDLDDDLSPREEKAMHVVNEYKLASGASGMMSASIPIIGPVAESLTIGAKQRFLMVEEIADIYEIKDKERNNY